MKIERTAISKSRLNLEDFLKSKLINKEKR